MTQVMDWMPEFASQLDYWVGGKDIDGSTNAVWIAHSWNIPATLWIAGEPNYDNGQCVFLDISNGLVMGDCEEERPSLCQLYD